jgi:hypothetical protein
VSLNYQDTFYDGTNSYYMTSEGSGGYTGGSSLSSMTITPSAGTLTGTWVLYQQN